ncbi:hypothetical protein ACLBXO_11970 [Methylobacterium sp. C33D]
MHYDTFRLGMNDRVRYQGEFYRPESRDDQARHWVLRRLTDGSALDGHRWHLSDRDHYRLRRSETILVEDDFFAPVGRLLSERSDDSDLSDLSEDELLTVAWKLEWCTRFYRARALLDGYVKAPPCTPKGLEAFIEREREPIHRWYVRTFRKPRPAGRFFKGTDPKPYDWPGASTLRDWLAAYEAKGHKKKAFRPQYKNCGNRHQLNGLIVSVIEREVQGYASKAQPTISDIYENVVERLDALNRDREPEDRLQVSERAVRRRVHQLDPLFKDAGRLGKERARRKYTPVGHGLESIDGIEPLRRMDRVEIDDWEMDLFTLINHKHARERLSPKAREKAKDIVRATRCTVTFAIDVVTRCVVGLNVSPNEPAVAGARGALRSVLVDKTPLAQAAGCQRDWPMFAKPREVATDGGPVFKGEFHDTVERLGIGHRYPGGNPTRRATVESSLRILKAFCRRFTGQSFSNVVKRGDYEADKLASLFAVDLETHLVRFIVDYYHERTHPEIAARPRTAWETAGNVLAGAPNAVQRQVGFGIRLDDRTIDAAGVTFLHIQYRHDKMALLHGSVGNRRLTAIVDPHDLRRILIRIPEEAKRNLDVEGEYMAFTARTEFHGVSALRHMNNSAALLALEAREDAEGRSFRLDALRSIKGAAEKARIRAGVPSDILSAKTYIELFAEFERAGARATKPRPAPVGPPMGADDEPGILGESMARPAGPAREVRPATDPDATPRSINRYSEDEE